MTSQTELARDMRRLWRVTRPPTAQIPNGRGGDRGPTPTAAHSLAGKALEKPKN